METSVFAIILSAGVLISLFCLYSQIKLQSEVKLGLQAFTPEVLESVVDKAVVDSKRTLESRMKAVETEWETVYEKLIRMERRQNGELGGRPRKKRAPDEITPEEAGIQPGGVALQSPAMTKRQALMARIATKKAKR